MSSSEQAVEDRVSYRAYLLWELEGRQEGHADEYWHRARHLVESEGESAYPPSQSQENRF